MSEKVSPGTETVKSKRYLLLSWKRPHDYEDINSCPRLIVVKDRRLKSSTIIEIYDGFFGRPKV